MCLESVLEQKGNRIQYNFRCTWLVKTGPLQTSLGGRLKEIPWALAKVHLFFCCDYNLAQFLAGDSLSYHKNMTFSTKDHDTDHWNCAKRFKGGWWYKSCHFSNLNGLYSQGANIHFGTGVNWKTGKGYQYSYKCSEMKFRPRV